jgi:ribosomal protein S18 acetylase RimI-like enzyme
MTAVLRLLGCDDSDLTARGCPDLFDNPVDPAQVAVFLADPRHHIAAAIAGDIPVGFVSAVDYVHPDKPRALWINEVSVVPAWRRRRVGLGLMRLMLDHARSLGCAEAWVLTDRDNTAARALYARAGGTSEGSDLVMVTFDFAQGTAR